MSPGAIGLAQTTILCLGHAHERPDQVLAVVRDDDRFNELGRGGLLGVGHDVTSPGKEGRSIRHRWLDALADCYSPESSVP